MRRYTQKLPEERRKHLKPHVIDTCNVWMAITASTHARHDTREPARYAERARRSQTNVSQYNHCTPCLHDCAMNPTVQVVTLAPLSLRLIPLFLMLIPLSLMLDE